MQNWNQWQLSAGAVATPMPQPPVGYAAPGADPMAMMQAYMQYYNQPPPSGYTAEQWAAAQQQNWAQWQQWQQQYQQWQAQYGEKYQETMKHMSAQNMNLANQVPQLPIVQPPPPLPKEDTKPPLPPTAMNTYQFTSMPPPHQNNLPLFPIKQDANVVMPQANSQNPPLPSSQPPLPPEGSNSSMESTNLNGKRSSSTVSESNSAKKMKVEEEELTEAEKTFDAQFKQWEEQFNKWKQQNANHPDKTQYKQYEAKWTSWREKLIERREQMRRKREQQKQAAAKAEVEKNKSLPGDDKIMNILSSTENQGLINNLLGIGKTLGLTGKQTTNVPPPPPPPPATESGNMPTVQTASSSQGATATAQLPLVNIVSSNMMTSTAWNSHNQQWPAQYNTGVNVPSFTNIQSMTGVPPPPFGAPPTQMPPPNFAQPPPNFPAVPNFSQPPPGFVGNDSRQNHNVRPLAPPNMQGRPPPFGPNYGNGQDGNGDRPNQGGSMNSFDPGHQGNFPMNDPTRQKDPERFGRDAMSNDQQANQYRHNAMFPQRNENYNLNDSRGNDGDQFRRDERNYQDHGNNQFGQQKMNFSNERFNPGSDRFGPGSNRFGPMNDRFGPGNDRFGPGENRFVSGSNDKFTDRTGQTNESVNDRFGPNSEPYGTAGDRFANRNSVDRFEQKDAGDNRRDSFPNNPRGFSRNNQFDPPDKFAPELKKLMEKRRAAMDVFKPSYLDSEKSTNVGSLSESFKRITGDSPFAKPGACNFGPRGPAGPGNFRIPVDFKPQGNPEFGPRGPTGIGRNNSFDSRDGGPFRGAVGSSPQQMQELMGHEARQEANTPGNPGDVGSENKNDPAMSEQSAVTSATPSEQVNIDNTQAGENLSAEKNIPILEKPPWMDVQLSQDNSLQKDSAKEEETPANCSSTEQDSRNVVDGSTEEKPELSGKEEDVNSQAKALPFMGENDPKPEDLNMEPPPELPNLGPVPTDQPADAAQRSDLKESSAKAFPSNPESFEPMFGPRGMPFRPNAPFHGPRGPNDARFPVFDPRGSNTFPFNSPGGEPYPMGPRGPNEFGPRGPTDGPFGPRGPNNGSFAPRGLNDPPFGPRGPSEAQFGPRGPNDGMFGPRGPNDGPFGPRGPNDNQFGLRGPDAGQFGPRASNIGQFGPRFDTQIGSRRSGEGQFGPRALNDGQFGPQAPNARPFAPGRPNDAPFDNRGPCDSQFALRGTNDGPRFTGPNDRLFGSRRNDPAYQRSPGGSKGGNDGQFGNRFNEKQFDGNSDSNSFGLQSPFTSRGPMSGPNDRPYDNRQFEARGIGEFRPRGSNDTTGPKISRNSDAADETVQADQNVDSKDKQNSGWRQFSKNSFGDIDQRSGRDFNYSEKTVHLQNESFNQSVMNNVERRSPGNKSNVSDKRSDKSIADLSMGYGDSPAGSDFSKFATSSMYMKRSDNRQAQVRGPTAKEFCIGKQFNYNHAGAGGEKKFIEHIPAKVIDYAHTARSSIQDHITPVQCFDYGHGNLKPTVPEHEIYPKKDFRNWEENEQNLREYTEKIRKYEYYAGKAESRRSLDFSQRRDDDIKEERSERRSDRDRREREDYRSKDRDDRIFDYKNDKDQDARYDKSANKERTCRERSESSHKETAKENEKNDDRSKGNINWQENSNKNVIDKKPAESSVTDTSQHVLDTPQKTLELAKTPNCTMVDDLLCPPGRQNRPPKIAIILRGPPGSGKSFVAKLIKDKEVEQGGSAPRILSLDDYFLVEKEIETTDDNGKKVTVKEMVYEYEEAMEPSYITSLVKAFKKNITDGFFNFIILDCINEKISDYEEMWSFAKTKGFKVYVCEMEMDLQICLKRNIHNRTEDEINRIIDYFEPAPSYHEKLDVNSMLQEQAIEEVHMEDSEEPQEKSSQQQNEDSQDSQDDTQDAIGVSKWERMEAEDKLDRLDGLAKKKNEGNVQTMKDFLQVPDYYNMEDTSGKKRVRWADLEERKEQEKMRAVGFVVGHTNWDRMMDPTKGGSALTRTKFFSLS